MTAHVRAELYRVARFRFVHTVTINRYFQTYSPTRWVHLRTCTHGLNRWAPPDLSYWPLLWRCHEFTRLIKPSPVSTHVLAIRSQTRSCRPKFTRARGFKKCPGEMWTKTASRWCNSRVEYISPPPDSSTQTGSYLKDVQVSRVRGRHRGAEHLRNTDSDAPARNIRVGKNKG